ncbi:dTDP-4-dehydrorhamnose reductase [Mycobacteroides franklinii]|uniref:dTDP-4-dehydrorhamnose reductase n=1 Tax=Mycobacteroides franklinii TaxID=948102 RepID=A0A1S1LDU8_9MYCO|nr:dTDP-4-dehydrorhamnose reductase [Mycobacteroides franklinii]OHU22250.1 dTDP-4-dehydrorhamnose reductase [Mycobacteroides franklinii]
MLVITGAGGQLGSHLIARAARRGLPIRALKSSDWDITAGDAPDGVVAEGDTVINCAAYTAVDAAESDEARAYAVNATGAANVARVCRDVGARLIHISTDYVFSGYFADSSPAPYRTDAATAPEGVYGRTKLAGEQAVHETLPSAHVVRTAWVYTGVGGDFVGVMRRLAGGDGPVRVVTDQTGSPTYAADLAEGLLDLTAAEVDAPILHATGGGVVNRFDWAKAVFDLVGADSSRVQPCLSADMPRPAPRPPYSALDGTQWTDAGLPPLRPWREALAEALATH